MSCGKRRAVRRTELDVVQAKGAAYIAESLTRLCDPLPFPEPIRRALVRAHGLFICSADPLYCTCMWLIFWVWHWQGQSVQ